MTGRAPFFAIAAAMTVAGIAFPVRPARAPVHGEAFGGPARKWKTVRTAPSGCDAPCRSIYLSARGDSTRTAFLGDTRITATPGCDPSYIFIDIECGPGETLREFCTVFFDASLWLVAGERAAVVLTGGSDGEGGRAETGKTGDREALAVYEIPGTRDGRRGRYAVSIPASGDVRVVFAVWNSARPGAGTRSMLLLKDVGWRVTNGDSTAESLVRVHPDAVPFESGGLAGHLLQIVPAITDCNDNGIPDVRDINQGTSQDGDADGVPDDCDGGTRRIDWVLLGTGILILVVTLVRIAWKHRARSA